MPQSDPATLHRRRRAVIDVLKRDGPQTAGALAESLGVTAMAVRQHLYELQDQGIVSHTAQPGGKGRPAKVWRLTEAAEGFFPDGHAELAASLLDDLRGVFGADGLDRLVRRRTASQVAAYRARMAPGLGLEERLRRLAEARSQEGYMAEVERQADGSFLLIENHCPICTAARACTGLCAAELECFRAVLGDSVEVERVSHILAGARRCAYRVTEAARTSAA